MIGAMNKLTQRRRAGARDLGVTAREFAILRRLDTPQKIQSFLNAIPINFEPDGLEIVINAALLDGPAGVEVSLTARMHEVAPPKSNMPRRDYPPPTAARIALGKLWQSYERELRQAGKIP